MVEHRDEQGRIATPSMSHGYFKDPEKTAQAFRVIDGQNYVLAGDWALRNADGSITLLGRGSSVINTGGEKVFPEEVEEAVKTFPGVADCIVTGVPHERFGAQVVAVVSMFPEAVASEENITQHVRDQIAAFKAPKHVVFVDAVPRHANGKPDLEGARDLAMASLTGPAT